MSDVVCQRVELATEQTADVELSDGTDDVWLARETIDSVTLSDGTDDVEVATC